MPIISTDISIEDEYIDWDEQTSIFVGFTGTSVSSSLSSGIQVGSSTVVFTTGGTYVLYGSYNGTIIVNAPGEEVRLVLNNLSVLSSQGSGLICLDASKLIISLPEETMNSIVDNLNYNYGDSELMKVNAAVYSKTDLVINGEGTLFIQGQYQDGLKANDSLVISDVSLTIQANDDAISVNDSLLIQSGTFNLESGGDGIKVSNDDDELGYLVIQDGDFVIHSFNDGLQASSYILIHGGTFEIVSGNGSNSILSSDESSKGIKASLGLEITEGTFTIDALDDSLHSDELVSIVGGVLTLSSGDQAIHSDNILSISSGEITVVTSVEGFEAKNISISGGTINISSSDDGINGSDPDVTAPDLPGTTGGDPTTSTATMTISGGIITIKSIEDSIDINGSFYQSGGIILISGPTNGMQSAVDYDIEWVVTGGLLIAVSGFGAETKVPSSNSTQVSLMYNTQSIQSVGKTVSIMDGEGNVMYSFTPTVSYQAITITSPDLIQGDSYTLVLGGTISGSIENGFYLNPTIEDGVSLQTMKLSSLVNSYNVTTFPSGPPRP